MDITELLKQPTVLFDGATGTEYQKRGLQVGHAPESWNLEQPDTVKAVHLDYIKAGSRVIETNTFGGNRLRLDAHGLGHNVREINIAGAKAALAAAGNRAVVAGSVGPLGALLEPYGELSVTKAEEIFEEQISALIAGGINFILIETMISSEEALVALRAAKKAGAKFIGVTMTFDPTEGGPRTSFGESPEAVAKALTEGGAHLIGSNCGKGFDVMRSVAQEMKRVARVPILLQPNAGMPEYETGKIVYRETPEEFASFVLEMAGLGIACVGGCCGTSPNHLKAAAEKLRMVKPQ
jgi:5-methyltetrahydrofolate--homocysteine methyltransferase